jgi:hypothetical protein
MAAPHDVPTAAQLVEAVREWIEKDLMTASDPRTKFHARVAANALLMVEREFEVGEAQAVAHGERLERLGVADDVELASAIRERRLDDRAEEVRALLLESIIDKLAVANPKYVPSP